MGACELRSPEPFTQAGFKAFNELYVGTLREWFVGVDRVELRRNEETAAAPKRLTDEMVRAERIASLKKRDPVLRAAIDALDLDVVD